jgi:cytochrome c oxidase subunit IV
MSITETTQATVPDDQLKESYTHHSDWVYIKVAIILAVLTAIEVSTYYFEDEYGAFFLPVLLGLMVIKFVMVLLYFMHLKYDAKIFSRLFYAGLFLALAVYIGALAAFQFFG